MGAELIDAMAAALLIGCLAWFNQMFPTMAD